MATRRRRPGRLVPHGLPSPVISDAAPSRRLGGAAVVVRPTLGRRIPVAPTVLPALGHRSRRPTVLFIPSRTTCRA
ncbi:unnamed protein product [Ectocarpus sp. CCAP 1310/34]|nr:unnamed protein product [Ectocarpus sp. CCAP 1310/34]